jgi:hypothetical protein
MKEKSFDTCLLGYAMDVHKQLKAYERFLDNLSPETWSLRWKHLGCYIRDLFL